MNQKTFIKIFFGTLVICFFLSTLALAGGIKERMKSRLPKINEFKTQEVIGENNTGFLEVLPGKKNPEAEKIVKEENDDRMKVYNAIARKQGTTPEKVGRRRALQIAEKSASGVWVQDAGGDWKKK